MLLNIVWIEISFDSRGNTFIKNSGFLFIGEHPSKIPGQVNHFEKQIQSRKQYLLDLQEKRCMINLEVVQIKIEEGQQLQMRKLSLYQYLIIMSILFFRNHLLFKMKYHSISGYSKKLMELRLIQEKFIDYCCQLAEKLKSLDLQKKHIQDICHHQITLSAAILFPLTTQTQTIKKQCEISRNLISNKLIKKQIQLLDQVQMRDCLKLYHERIQQLDFNVYTKQVDITVDHVGKLESEKPLISRVRTYTNIKVEQANLIYLLKVIKKLNSDLAESRAIFAQKSKRSQFLSTENSSNVTKKHPDKQIKSESMLTKNSFYIERSQSNPQSVINNRSKRRVILSSEQSIYTQLSKNFDPQLIQLAEMIRGQDKKQADLYKKMINLSSIVKKIDLQHSLLSESYRKYIGASSKSQSIQRENQS